MPRLTRIYTRTGDDGSTGLGTSRRVGKDSLRVEAYGCVDELSSQLGLAMALGPSSETREVLRRVQHELFNAGSDLAVPEDDKRDLAVPVLEERHVHALELWIDAMLAELAPLENFVLPGGTAPAAALHVARAVCRRAERRAVALSRVEPVGASVVRYLNRLSDALFVAARLENLRAGSPDVLWDSRS